MKTRDASSAELSTERMVNLLHQSVPEPKPDNDPMQGAEHKLMDALRARRLRMLIERGGTFDEVSEEIYEYAVAVNARGSVEADASASARDYTRALSYLSRLPTIGNVWFRKAELLDVWPLRGGGAESAAAEGERAEPLVADGTTPAAAPEPEKDVPLSGQVGEQASEPERPAEPSDFTAPWQGWPPAHVYLAQPALLLAAAPGSHDCSPDGVREELWRAVEARVIRHQVVVEAQIYVPPLSGLVQGQITDPQLWRRVDRVRGVLELPPGTVRVIKICEADALVHFQTWPRQQREAADPVAADTANKTPTADAPEASEDITAMPDGLLALEDLAGYNDLRARALVLNSVRPYATDKLSETIALRLARTKYGTSLDARPALLKNITDSQRHRAWSEANKMHKRAQE
jgi:hypothetical protein